MKKIIVFTLLNIVSWANAQLTNIRYIPSISTDTLSTQAQLYPSFLNRKFNPVVFERGIKIGARRKEVRLRDKDISYIEFKDKNGKERSFKQIPELGLDGKLLEIMTVGKISWYRHHFDYKSDAWDQTIAYDDYFIKGKEIVKVPVKGKYKKKLRNLVSERPELVQEVNKMVNDLDIGEILEKYNNN